MYSTWINNHVKSYDDAYGKCKQICELMLKEFPELILVRGHYYCAIWGKRQHWWLKAENGKVVDPTWVQFPSLGNGEYVELDESQPEPTGICPNCGEHCYNSSFVCCVNCEVAYMAYINGEN